VLALAIVYILATIFSVTPSTSLWGSYQRLQGTYTTLSYLVVFSRCRRTASKGTSRAFWWGDDPFQPAVSLYGILQRYGADPIPWGGDVSVRIAGEHGQFNFIAAYLIMVFPLTLMRVVESFEALTTDNSVRRSDNH